MDNGHPQRRGQGPPRSGISPPPSAAAVNLSRELLCSTSLLEPKVWVRCQMGGTWRMYQRTALRVYDTPSWRCLVALAIACDFISR